MSGLPREVLKWIQSLDLTRPVKNTRRDFSNGYLIAEIFSWYYPQEIQMHSFDNGMSIETKMGNWSIIQRFFQRAEFDIPQDEVQGTIHCKPGAAILLIQRIYTILTNRIIKAPGVEELTDFTDNSYQAKLPMHARTTATQAIKNNIATSELHTDPDRILCRQKAQEIIRFHVQNRQNQRVEDPKRFGIKPNICQRSPRKTPTEGYNEEVDDEKHYDENDYNDTNEIQDYIHEIPVQQAGY
eukprot:gene7212-8020_t